jgi:hypothetical protein
MAKYGLMVKDLGIKTYCSEEALDLDVSKGAISSDPCAKEINHDYIQSELKKCHGNKTCQLNFRDTSKLTTSTFDSEGQCGSDAYIFVQVPCVIPEEAMAHR